MRMTIFDAKHFFLAGFVIECVANSRCGVVGSCLGEILDRLGELNGLHLGALNSLQKNHIKQIILKMRH